MLIYENYFSAKAIIKTLCKYRIKQAKKKHKYKLLRDVSLHKVSLILLQRKHNCPPDLKELFPSRRKWHRANAAERKKFANSQELTIYSLYKTITATHYKVVNGQIEAPIWYTKLQNFISKIQTRAFDPDSQPLNEPVISPQKKEDKITCKICRPISLYNLEDRLIIGLTSKYLTDLFDPYLHDSCFAFRSSRRNPIITHHDAINKILEYKNARINKNIYVAECDLEKFFDCLEHTSIISAFERFCDKLTLDGFILHECAKKIFHQYLESYTFNKTVLKYNNPSFFNQFKIDGGVFQWPETQLINDFYGENIFKVNIGVPQGGALSCLIANLLLHEVDHVVDPLINRDSDLLYVRFCDDMVILHTDKLQCSTSLNRYLEKINSLKLIVHNPVLIEKYDRTFWDTKSKSPYHWSRKSTPDRVPWLGFVGYQIRYDGAIRVRKKALIKEAKKQKDEMKSVLEALHVNNRTRHKINEHSRKSLKQQIFALESRYISMSVGRSNIYNFRKIESGLCWTNGFKCLNINFVSRTQCKYLDRRRKQHLKKFAKTLGGLTRINNDIPEIDDKLFLGHPYSYHGFLR